MITGRNLRKMCFAEASKGGGIKTYFLPSSESLSIQVFNKNYNIDHKRKLISGWSASFSNTLEHNMAVWREDKFKRINVVLVQLVTAILDRFVPNTNAQSLNL